MDCASNWVGLNFVSHKLINPRIFDSVRPGHGWWQPISRKTLEVTHAEFPLAKA